jgi:hypothetical protein
MGGEKAFDVLLRNLKRRVFNLVDREKGLLRVYYGVRRHGERVGRVVAVMD